MSELALGIDRVEAAIRAATPSARVIYLEPDIARSTAGPAPGPDAESEPEAEAGPRPETGLESGAGAGEPEPDPAH
jgi:hypothetical protein